MATALFGGCAFGIFASALSAGSKRLFRSPKRATIPPALTVGVRAKIPEDRRISCPEKVRLRNEYNKAVSEWSHVTEQFEKSAGKFAERSKELREAAMKAKAAYEDHKSSHGC
jgi:hypothetical protein